MDDMLISMKNEADETPTQNDVQSLVRDDEYSYINYPYTVEILKIDDKENTLTLKYLNSKEKDEVKTIQISEYLDFMKKYTYLYVKCSLCHKKQKGFKDKKIMSYCIKCDTIICYDCIDKHLKTNEKNHHDLNNNFIIKINEKSIKCLLHPKEKNFAFCLKCKKHICTECMKSQSHINHTKINIIEVSVTDKIKTMLTDIINIYNENIKQLNKEKEKIDNKKEEDRQNKEEQKKGKLKELQKRLKKELNRNDNLLNDNLYKLKIKYENEVKL